MARRKQRTDRQSAGVTGFVVYDGPSELDSSPIVAILTLQSSNRKTGPMAQLWILPKDIDPLAAIRAGSNAGVCGTCDLQGKYDPATGKMVGRVCYVNLGQAPLSIWQAYVRGIYPRYARTIHESLLRIRDIRLGAYGDPAALPCELVEYLAMVGKGWTGYTHQAFWIEPERAERITRYCMVSCHNLAQYHEAQRRGWRAFLAVPASAASAASAAVPHDAVRCPYDTHGTTCQTCQMCQGTAKQARSIWIEAHGAVGKNLAKITSEV